VGSSCPARRRDPSRTGVVGGRGTPGWPGGWGEAVGARPAKPKRRISPFSWCEPTSGGGRWP